MDQSTCSWFPGGKIKFQYKFGESQKESETFYVLRVFFTLGWAYLEFLFKANKQI